jgi:hypothetical protein
MENKAYKNAVYTEGSLQPSAFYFLGDKTADLWLKSKKVKRIVSA